MANTYGIVRSDRGYLLTGRNTVYTTGGDTALIIPTQSGSSINFPPKYHDDEATANNLFDTTEFAGIYYPTVSGVCEADSGWFTAANLNAWFITRGATRGQKGYDDLAEVTGGAIYSDGHRAIAVLKPKGDSLRISSRQDDTVRCALSFMGADHTELTWEDVATDALARASFADVTFVSGVTGVTEFELSIMNRCRPNPIFGDGSGNAVKEINAGKAVVTLSLTVDAAGVFPTNGSSIVFTITPPGATAITFTIAKVRIDDPDNLSKSGERVSQTFNMVCKSTDGKTFPLTIA